MNLIKFFPNQTEYAIVAVAVACVLPFFIAAAAKLAGGFKGKDNLTPREFLANTTGLAARLNAAQANSYESLPFFVGGVILAMYCFVPQHIVNILAWLYVVLRIIFLFAYAFNMAAFRSIIWFLSILCCLQFYLLACRMI